MPCRTVPTPVTPLSTLPCPYLYLLLLPRPQPLAHSLTPAAHPQGPTSGPPYLLPFPFPLPFSFSVCFLEFSNQKLKTKVIKKNTNPVWNEELTLSIEDPNIPISVNVFDKDFLSRDDSMGHAEFDIRTFIEVVKRDLSNVPNGTVVQKITPSRQNCLAEESAIYKAEGTIMQDMALRLKDVECGEIELRLTWGTIPGARGLERF